ncbi:hypothetical protein BDN71DRAFT_1442983 [Pleurotus eryngii]|uniref:RING-type domain-containing protein n=1 Tax=Pleurotus eryngii TaxID=5323 RepID=A0A9P6A7L7_PLEER|nr:hypothetical protein BDN71DRAFT_1442983 [Pleurotus eryngii]
MAYSRFAKGKKRAIKEEEEESSTSPSLSSLSPEPTQRPVVKKPKRAETRKCPVCEEQIPVRLLAKHSELESERVEEIIKDIGSSKGEYQASQAGTRRSAARARKSMSAMNTRSSATADILEETCKAIQIIKRHRKRRHAKLREMTREDEEGRTKAVQSSGIVCPVCAQPVPGDQDVVEAHVDACLASEARRIDVEQQDEAGPSHPTDWGGNDSRIGNVSGLRGAGFNIRNHTQKDVDDEVDIDGDDEAVFGTAQFTERDIMRIDAVRMEEEESGDEDVDIGGPWERQRSTSSMQAREQATNTPEDGILIDVTEPNEVDLLITAARHGGHIQSLVTALQRKIQQLESSQSTSSASLQCRICLDPYTEPTVSTGCWHTCCRECWLRCLGSTKLCPICKRITIATDLRRIYL